MRHKIVILCLILSAAAAFFAFDFEHYLNLSTLKARHGELVGLFDRRPLLVAGGFMLVQVTALALSLPGAVLPLALAGGAIFGPVWGTVIVLAAIVIGDSLGFLVARYLARDLVQRAFGTYLPGIERGIEKEGAFYLLALRLMAVIPYFIVNLTFGLTRMPLKVFAPVSLLGLIPSTILYVNAGTELSRLSKASDIYSPRLIAAFVLLGLLPIAARLLLKSQLLRRALSRMRSNSGTPAGK